MKNTFSIDENTFIYKKYYHKYFLGTCNVCGSQKWIRADRTESAKCCTIQHSYPYLSKYMINKEDAVNYAPKSHQKIWWKCPDCGFEFMRSINDVTNRGFSCPICSIKISFPNRFVSELLKHLSVDFEREKIFSWSDKKRYDFYISPDTIIEVNGFQHYNDIPSFGIKASEIQRDDENKILLALKNGIKRYIVIDARHSDDAWLVENISKELKDIYDLSKIDWEIISDKSSKGLTKKCKELFEAGKSTIQIAEMLNVDIDVVRKKLKFLTDLGRCNYSPLESWLNRQKEMSNNNKKPVICITTNKTFDSINEAADYYKISRTALSNCMTGRCHSSGSLNGEKLFWKFKEEK